MSSKLCHSRLLCQSGPFFQGLLKFSKSKSKLQRLPSSPCQATAGTVYYEPGEFSKSIAVPLISNTRGPPADGHFVQDGWGS